MYILIDNFFGLVESAMINAVKQQSDSNNHTVQLLNMQNVKKLHSMQKKLMYVVF